jgi:hypothetical protein
MYTYSLLVNNLLLLLFYLFTTFTLPLALLTSLVFLLGDMGSPKNEILNFWDVADTRWNLTYRAEKLREAPKVASRKSFEIKFVITYC